MSDPTPVSFSDHGKGRPVYEFRPLPNFFKGVGFHRYADGAWIPDDGEYDLAFATVEFGSICLYFEHPHPANLEWSWLSTHWSQNVEGHARRKPWHRATRDGSVPISVRVGPRTSHPNVIAGKSGMNWACAIRRCANAGASSAVLWTRIFGPVSFATVKLRLSSRRLPICAASIATGWLFLVLRRFPMSDPTPVSFSDHGGGAWQRSMSRPMGPYFGLPGIEAWDQHRDARLIQARGPWWLTRRANAGAASGTAAPASRTSISLAMMVAASRTPCLPSAASAASWNTRPIAGHGNTMALRRRCATAAGSEPTHTAAGLATSSRGTTATLPGSRRGSMPPASKSLT